MKRKGKSEQPQHSENEIKIPQDQTDADSEVVICDCEQEDQTSNPGADLIQDHIKQLMQDVEEANSKYLRSLADFDNYRKRQREDVARQISRAREDLLGQVVNIADNLNRALVASAESEDFNSLLEGLNLILRQMVEMLQKEGVAPIEAEGQQFDPELHEAMMRDMSGQYPDNTIIEEFEKGYTFEGRVLRPSKVRVAAQ